MEPTPAAAEPDEGRDWSRWPRYNEASLGFRDYWYPVLWSRELSSKPRGLTLLGEPIMFMRDRGKAYALRDRCMHRGVPLSLGVGPLGRAVASRQWFPGTISCGYHGWTYDLATGELVAVLTDGPDSAMCGKARVRSYPVEERLGLVWIYMGQGTPPPVEDDIPDELLRGNPPICGKITERTGNWRYAAENGLDEGHARYLHRYTPYLLWRQQPCWTKVHLQWSEDRKWMEHVRDEVHREGDFPGLGKWPPQKRLVAPQRSGLSSGIAIRLPGLLRVHMRGMLNYNIVHYEWYVPVDGDNHRYIQIATNFTSGLKALMFKLRYLTYIRLLFHGWFNGQDAVMVRAISAPPERLYRPDRSIIAWRKMCERARGGEMAFTQGTLVEEELTV